jgi:Fe-S cluster biogenesis protein NfuA
VDDTAWQSRVESIVRTMVQPLVADGGRFEIESCDPSTKQVVVRASFADCETCVMSDDDLARLLEEAVRRADHDTRLSVVSDG